MTISFVKFRMHLLTALKTSLRAPAMMILLLGATQSYGAVDSNFNVGGSGANDIVYAMAVRPDGKILIGGMFSTVNGTSKPKLALLNTNGTLDSSFTLTPNVGIRAIAVQTNGAFLVGGTFTIGGTNWTGVARILTNGTLDLLSVPTLGGVLAIDVDPNGYIIVAGSFTSPTRAITRLLPDGDLDTEFPVVASAGINCIAINKDPASDHYGKIYIGGTFTSPGIRVARLNNDGSLDTSFYTSANNDVYAVALQKIDGNDKVLIGGTFTSNDWITSARLTRLNAGGNSDGTVGSPDNQVRCILANSDGTFLAGGYFTHAGAYSRVGIARFLSTGAVDTSWTPGYGPLLPGGYSGSVWCMTAQGTNTVVGGYFSSWNGNGHYMYERLLP
jgi:uncharacterized delta-60 repeat protein